MRASWLVLIAVASTRVHADDKAVAEAAFEEGRRLVAKGDYAAACPKFEASYRADPGLGALLNLADCHTHVGRTASAWAEFTEAEEKLRRANDKRADFAKEHAAALVPRLVRIKVVGPAKDVAGLVVKRDGADISQLLGTAIPVDPGDHAIEASAPGFVTWSTRVHAVDEGKTVGVTIAQLAKVDDKAMLARYVVFSDKLVDVVAGAGTDCERMASDVSALLDGNEELLAWAAGGSGRNIMTKETAAHLQANVDEMAKHLQPCADNKHLETVFKRLY